MVRGEWGGEEGEAGVLLRPGSSVEGEGREDKRRRETIAALRSLTRGGALTEQLGKGKGTVNLCYDF